MYAQGTLQNMHSGHTGVDRIVSEVDMAYFGFDPDRPLSLQDEDYQVSVPAINLRYLSDNCHPLNDDGLDGRQEYINCLQILSTWDL